METESIPSNEVKTNDKTILCECGHPLIWHSFAHQCNASMRRTERKKDTTGKYVKVKCCYVCYCKEFKLKEINKIDQEEEK